MKKNKVLIIILITCLVILVFGGLGYYLLNNNKPKEKEPERSEYSKHANDPSYYIDGKIGVGMIINY